MKKRIKRTEFAVSLTLMNFNAINETIKLLVLFKIDEIIFRILGCSFGTPYKFSFDDFSIYPIENKLKVIISITSKIIDLLIFYFTTKLKRTSKRLNIFERILVYVLMRTNSDTNAYRIHANIIDSIEMNKTSTVLERFEIDESFHRDFMATMKSRGPMGMRGGCCTGCNELVTSVKAVFDLLKGKYCRIVRRRLFQEFLCTYTGSSPFRYRNNRFKALDGIDSKRTDVKYTRGCR